MADFVHSACCGYYLECLDSKRILDWECFFSVLSANDLRDEPIHAGHAHRRPAGRNAESDMLCRAHLVYDNKVAPTS